MTRNDWIEFGDRLADDLEGDGPLWVVAIVMLLAVIVFGAAVVAWL